MRIEIKNKNKHKIDLVVHAHNKDEDEKYYFMYKNCIKLLQLNEDIKIGRDTLKNIMENKY